MPPELIVADDIAGPAVTLFLEAHPRTVILTGGQTPRPVYERLAKESFDWSNVDVFFGDERCVPPDDPDSNYGMAFKSLLSHVPARVHRMPGETCDASAYEGDLRRFFAAGPPSFDFAFHGLGADGHSASLFPGSAALDERERWVLKVPHSDHERLTLTLPVLSAVRLAVFLVSGEEKREALRQLMAGKDIPAGRVKAGRLVVVADKVAASGLEEAA
jgi:6-phosphogluconolactonase